MASSIAVTIKHDQLTLNPIQTFRDNTCSWEASRIMREPLRCHSDYRMGRISLATARTEAPIDDPRMTSLSIASFFTY